MSRVREWWNGEPYKNDPRSTVVFVNSVDRHWTSRAAHALTDFYLAHWKWIWTIATSIVVAAVLRR